MTETTAIQQSAFALALAAAGQLVAALSSPPADFSIKSDYLGGYYLDLHFYNNPGGVAEFARLLAVEVETSPHTDTKGVMSKVLTSAEAVLDGGMTVRAWVLADAEAPAVAA
ncbi:hypothetical protein [Streptomyces sp. NPDC008240]|uniref:hypothetical protein n=1 Tax=Streptomyces sp. NPDC008240 TaxID=3364822 RepID=UPI0036E4DC68